MAQDGSTYLDSSDVCGYHNSQIDKTLERLNHSGVTRNLSTVCLVPSLGSIPTRVVASWLAMQFPRNQNFCYVFAVGKEVGEAYSGMVDRILDSPLSESRFLLTLEEDNMPPSDGIYKLQQSMLHSDYDVIGSLYWEKREDGVPMIFGNPSDPMDGKPLTPIDNTIQECNVVGMGFTIFRMDIFKDSRVPKPFFRTVKEDNQFETQDFYFCRNIRQLGYRVACNTSVKVGHYDIGEDKIW